MSDVYVVTGGASGIGREIAALLPKDVPVVLGDHAAERLERTTSFLKNQGHLVESFPLDISNREEVRDFASFAASFGKVKKVFHCAGVSGSMTDRKSILRINALGTVYINQEFYRVMDGGVICDFASNSSYVLPRFLMPSEHVYRLVLKNEGKFLQKMYRRCHLIPSEKWNRQVAYLVSKNFARWYAQKCSFRYMEEKGIRVFSISPGFVKTPMTEAEKGFLSANILTFTAKGKGAEPEELAALAIHLSDESCSYLFGTDIRADGGCVDNGYRMVTCFRPFLRKKMEGNW